MIGQTLGHYHIESKLGEGGMGAVWKARDTRLDRFVALKTLPPEKLADEERRRRFVQEAKAASALNHPNIVHIYDIADADAVPFIAMEYVAGKTLDQLIGRKGLRLSESLKYAIQIADALARAHSAGIIHRDLKPSNIMVDEHGLVKVLDFGLAKLTETTQGDAGETATIRAGTEEGAIVGTVAYMSPEQAEAKPVDARSDIFSFGSLLYEMATGQRAFRGDSKLSTLSAVLKDEPKPASSVAPDVPRDLEKIITHCLRKDPARRFQHMDDVKTLLEELKEESESGKLVAPDKATPARARRWWLPALAVLVAAVGLGTWLWLRTTTTPRAAPKMIPLTSYPGWQRSPALSPDGKQVAFSWDGEKGDNFDIYVKLVDGGTPLRLTTNPAEEDYPAWSPDGSRITFLRQSGSTADLVVIPSLGGQERKLCQTSEVPGLFASRRPSWSPDGKFLAVVDRPPNESAGIFLVSAESGEKRRITSTPVDYIGDASPSFSPDGRSLAFIRVRGFASHDIYVMPVDANGSAAGEPRRITFNPDFIRSADWTSDGRRLVFSVEGSGAVALQMVAIAGGQAAPLPGAGEYGEAPSLARHGNRLVYERSVADRNIWRIPGPNSTNRKAAPEKWIASTEQDKEPQFSPDGKRIVFASSRSGNYELWTCAANGREVTQLTSLGGPPAGSPRWSPDSRSIAFDAPKSGNSHIFVISSEGGLPRQLTQGETNNVLPSWSGDGKWIYFSSKRSGDWQIWKAPARGGGAVEVTKAGGYAAFESLDGKLLFYAKPQTAGIWSAPVEGGEETQIMEKSVRSFWAVAKDGICFFDLTDAPHSILRFYSFRDRRSTVLYEFPPGTNVSSPNGTAMSVSHDGQWIIYTQLDQAGSNLMLVENFE